MSAKKKERDRRDEIDWFLFIVAALIVVIVVGGFVLLYFATKSDAHEQPPLRPTAAVTPIEDPVFSSLPKLDWPFSGKISIFYGVSRTGITIESPLSHSGNFTKQPVVAAADGIVIYAGQDLAPGYQINESFPAALHVTVLHSNGIATVYGSLGSITVKDGQIVKKGDMLGETSSLLFGVLVAGKFEDPLHYLEGGKYE